ncbi:hypothetical protein EDD85DRAFT_945872 [Armillaria nabsnona]|nr:hypothetical protein EDD85DRAFT_945872 [Armillaria nabsnona]
MLPEDYEEDPTLRDEGYEFGRRVAIIGSIANAFRVFTEGEVCNELLDLRIAPPSDVILAATDGSCHENGTEEARAGAGIFVEGENRLERALRVPSNLQQTNQVGEALAAKVLADSVNTRTMLHNDTDSKYVLKHLTTSLQTMEDAGYIGIPNKKILQAMVASYRRRKQISTMNWIKGHSGHHGNERVDRPAEEGAWKDPVESMNLEVTPTLRVTGAALFKLSQSRAYKALRKRNNEKLTRRRTTVENVKQAQRGAIESFGFKPTESALWKLLRHKDINRNTTYLLWMAMHDTYRIGAKWLHFGAQYHSLEDMAHIMTSCESPGQKEVWELTKSILEKRGIPWHTPLNGQYSLMCRPSLQNSQRDQRLRKGTLLPNSVQVIWNARCKRVI